MICKLIFQTVKCKLFRSCSLVLHASSEFIWSTHNIHAFLNSLNLLICITACDWNLKCTIISHCQKAQCIWCNNRGIDWERRMSQGNISPVLLVYHSFSLSVMHMHECKYAHHRVIQRLMAQMCFHSLRSHSSLPNLFDLKNFSASYLVFYLSNTRICTSRTVSSAWLTMWKAEHGKERRKERRTDRVHML